MPSQYTPKTWELFLSEYKLVCHPKKEKIEEKLGYPKLKHALGNWDEEIKTEIVNVVTAPEIKWDDEIAELTEQMWLHADIKFLKLLNEASELNKTNTKDPVITQFCITILALTRELLKDLDNANNNAELETPSETEFKDQVNQFVNEALQKVQTILLYKNNLKKMNELKIKAKEIPDLKLINLFAKATSLNEKIFHYPKLAEVCKPTLDLIDELIKDAPTIKENEQPKQQLEKIDEINKTADNTANYLDRIILSPLNNQTPLAPEQAKAMTTNYITANTKLTLKKTISDIVYALGTIALGFCCGLIIGGIIGLATGVVHAPVIALSAGIAGAALATGYQAHKLAGPFGLFPVESPALPKIKDFGKNAENFAEQFLTHYKL